MAKTLMIQGTMSGAGKSLLVAGLCRILKEDGVKVAPFKSQNMALNSYITEDGLEMGRAQVVQAEAAGIKPSVYMNPILLKPTNDIGSQVIVNGEVLGNMKARDYFAYKKNLVPHILHAFEELSKEYDVIIIEGAGSPAEINLKQQDIVNMGMAKLADAPVLLAGDIDRGGVFAQLLGTVELLEEDERERIKGLIINKFRGDKTILDPGIEMLEARVGIHVAGTIPYMKVDIEEEDSLTERFEERREAASIDIAVVRFPRISNYTDIAPLENIAGVSVRYVTRAADLKNPDMIVLPGSKNTMGDLTWMRESGMEAKILKLHREGVFLFGICGGYQMMGSVLEDPDGVENGGVMRGMELLPMRTVFLGEKTRTRVEGTVPQLQGEWEALSGAAYEGYEIHMGRTTAEGEAEVFLENESGTLGISNGHAAGTYVHGIFDTEEMASGILSLLAKHKGLEEDQIKGRDFKEYKEEQYRILASEMRKHLDMKQIYEIIEKGMKYDGTI